MCQCEAERVCDDHSFSLRFQRVESMQVEGRRSGEGGGSGSRVQGGRNRRLDSTSRPDADEEDEAIHMDLAEARAAATTMSPREEVCLTRLNVPPNGQGSRRTSANSSLYSRIPDNFNRFPVGGFNLCVWVWVTFIILTMLLLPAHLYLKNSHYHVALIGILFVIILLFLVCFSVSLFHTKTRAILLHRLNLEDEARCGLEGDPSSPSRRSPIFTGSSMAHNRSGGRHSRPFSPLHMSVSTPDLLVNGQMAGTRDFVARSQSQAARGTPYGVIRTQEAHDSRVEMSPASDAGSDPPPYHVAILLPDPTRPTNARETPPPAYEILQ